MHVPGKLVFLACLLVIAGQAQPERIEAYTSSQSSDTRLKQAVLVPNPDLASVLDSEYTFAETHKPPEVKPPESEENLDVCNQPPFEAISEMWQAVKTEDLYLIGKCYFFAQEKTVDYGLPDWPEGRVDFSYGDIYTVLATAPIHHIEGWSEVDPETGEVSGMPAYSRTCYVSTVSVYDADGKLVDYATYFDRAQALYVVGFNSGAYRDYMVLRLMLDGTYVLDLDDDGHLKFLYLQSKTFRREQPLILMDIDWDHECEAIVSLATRPSVTVAVGDLETWMDNWSYPNGTPVADIKQGFVAVELDGVTQQPFTYYPELVLK